jgi:hypothetical protein
MAHLPLNHPLRPVYRALGGLIGLYAIIFGVVGFATTSHLATFASPGEWVLGQRANPAYCVVSVVLGLALLVGAVLGRNLDHFVFLWVGVTYIVIGTLMLALLQTDANILGFSMTNVIVVLLLGVVLFAGGLYTKLGSPEAARAEHDWATGESR